MSSKNSRHAKKKDSKLDEFIVDVDEIKPITSAKEQSEFIAKTMDMQKQRESEKEPKKVKEEKKDTKFKEKTEEKKDTSHKLVKHIDDVQHSIKKDIEIRKIIKPATPTPGIRKTADLLGRGFHYFVEFEEKVTGGFIFTWLPSKIRKYLKLIIPFLVMFIVLNLNLSVDYNIKAALAMFLCIALLWTMESINIIVTALLIPVLGVILGLIKNSNPFSSFSNSVIYLLLSGLIIAQAFRKHELDKMLAVKVLALSKGNMKRLLFFSMLITALFGMWMSNTATVALLVPVIITLSVEINHRIHKSYTSMLLLSTGFSAAIGGISTILGSNPNAITAAFLRNISEFTFFDWVQIGFPISVVLFIVVYFLFVKIYKVGDEKVKITSLTHEARKIKLNHAQSKLLRIFIPTVFLWMLGGKLTTFLHLPVDFYRTEVIGLTSVIFLFAFRVLEWEDVRRIPWEIFLLVGGGLTLGQILIDTGTAAFIAQKIAIVLSVLPTYFVILVFVFLAILLTNFVNNSSTTIILVPVLLNLSNYLQIGIHPWLLAMTAAMATAIAPLTPIAMPAFAIIYGTGRVTGKEMIKTGLIISSVCSVVLAGLIYFMNMFFF